MTIKPNLILDLDNTLICSLPYNEIDIKKIKKKMTKFKHHDMIGYYIVFERPNLQKFLDYAFKHYNVSVWTAASKDYALFIINNCILTKKSRKLDWIFFSYHCTKSIEKMKSVKDLRILWEEFGLTSYNLKNTRILDDNDEVYKAQPKNCIVAKPFNFSDEGSENDDFLKNPSKLLA